MTSIESIGSSPVQRVVQFRIKPDSDLLKAIAEAVEAEGVKAGSLFPAGCPPKSDFSKPEGVSGKISRNTRRPPLSGNHGPHGTCVADGVDSPQS